MQFALFYHSLISDWNHGNAHFLRGVVRELCARGHDVRVYEPRDAWSVTNLIQERGEAALEKVYEVYPDLPHSVRYEPARLDLNEVLAEAEVVLVHEWNDHELVRRIGQHRKRHDHYRLIFHDTHHRAVSDPRSMGAYDLSAYDGVLAFGQVIRDLYLENRWTERAWTWHEAADIRLFHPMPEVEPEGDLVWIGNWGDDERSEELRRFLLEPVAALGLKARVHGVRYPEDARKALAEAGIDYAGWLPNYRAPLTFAQHRVTVHVPRRPYVESLPGIPTIRPFEALACGIPLVSSPWDDAESLFTPGADYLVARDGEEMRTHLHTLLNDPARAAELAAHGRQTLLDRHSCGHRVDELMGICAELGLRTENEPCEGSRNHAADGVIASALETAVRS